MGEEKFKAAVVNRYFKKFYRKQKVKKLANGWGSEIKRTFVFCFCVFLLKQCSRVGKRDGFSLCQKH